MIFRRCAVLFLATGGYVGRIPKAPGTAGALMALPIIYVLAQFRPALSALMCIVLTAFAVWIAAAAERQLGAKDPGCIVIDEIAGMTVALLGIPLNLGTGAAGFLLFRFFDVLKPPPVRLLERHLSGGWGVVMDDIAAGVMANLVLRIGLYLSH
ncbi:MAG: phosphatidylglycerophosphatase A [Desulfobacteraceae bacterium]|nr:MAG: phosphatidylglycerophosphatase A [Desulfobacteraceae bacterium]